MGLSQDVWESPILGLLAPCAQAGPTNLAASRGSYLSTAQPRPKEPKSYQNVFQLLSAVLKESVRHPIAFLCFLCSTLFCSSPMLLYEVYVQFHRHSVSQKDCASPLLLMNIWVVCTWGLFGGMVLGASLRVCPGAGLQRCL